MNTSSDVSVSLETLIGCSRLLGHHLENRRRIRNKTDENLLAEFQESSTVAIDDAQGKKFMLAPLDILVERTTSGNKFHVIELNGSGIGGFTNMTINAVSEVLAEFENEAAHPSDELPLILIGLSGKENEGNPRLNRLAYEKILYADSMRKGLLKNHRRVAVTTMASVLETPKAIKQKTPTIVVGYLKEFLNGLRCKDGRLMIGNRNVTTIVNDRLALNICSKFQPLDEDALSVVNRCFKAGADKSVVYRHLNTYGEPGDAHPCFATDVKFDICATAKDIKACVLRRISHGEKVVIKPFGTGLGHGIQFFLDRDESEESVSEKIQGSLDETQRFYGLNGGALPYTVCNYINTAVVEEEDSPFRGRKFELRIVIYKAGLELKAFPLIAKVSPQVFDQEHVDRAMLINNITNSITTTQKSGMEFMLPLCRESTLQTLGISKEEIIALSRECTQFTKFVLAETK